MTHAKFSRGLVPLSILTVVLLVGGFAMVFFYAPNEADQGFVQKIFYLHVPLAIVALIGFVAGGVYGIRFLRKGDRTDDLRSYVAIHISLILAVAALITGSIWAKASWGSWWVWDEPTLVSFLIVFLLYACYQPLRFSIEDPERQARYAAVFAIVGGAFVPLNFMAVRAAESLVHPRVLSHHGRRDARLDAAHVPGLPRRHGAAVRDAVQVRADLQAGDVRAAVAQAPDGRRRRLGPRPPQRGPAAVNPALPLDDAGPYVAAAYLVFLALVLIYVAIMAVKLSRISARHRRAGGARGSAATSEREAAARGGAAVSELLALGTSHKTAPLALREKLALLDGGAEALIRELTGHDEHRRGRRDLHLQPHRALPRRLRPRRGRVARAGAARAPRRDPAHRADGQHVLAAQLRRRAPPVPRHERPRVDDRRRGRGPGPGQARVRAARSPPARPGR